LLEYCIHYDKKLSRAINGEWKLGETTPLGETAPKDIIDRLEARIFSPANRPKEPPTRFHLGGINICTPGNLTAISAPPKAGKSAAIGGMIASTFADADKDCLGFYSDNRDGLAVVHFDTEQCPYDHWQLVNRALKRAGLEAAPAWLRSYCVTGFSCSDKLPPL
jgi:hypothetical protein